MRNDQLSIEPTDVHARISISHGEKLITDGNQPATLAETLESTARKYGESRGIVYLLEDGSELHQSYGDLWNDARSVAEGLRHSGLQPQDVLLMQLPHNEQFIPAFWGCALAGCVPSPLAVAPTYAEVDSAAQKLKDAWTTLNHPPILTNRERLPELQNWADMMGLSQIRLLVIEELLEFEKTDHWHQALPEDLAILVLTSGSTGAPKAVMLSHSNILSMVKGMIQMYGFTDQDVTFNWMPFDHVGGIFMMHLRDVYLGCQEINVTGQSILVDPLSWLDGIDRYRASVTWAPNFAFGLVNDYSQEISSQKWDLSSMRFMFNGGEAAVAKVVRAFLTLLEPHGLPSNAIRPAWGMSETSSGVIFSNRFMRSTTRDEDDFVETGLPIPGLSIRIVDDQHQLMPEGSIGRLQVKGMSITSGYYRQPELSQSAFTADGWFETGDLGFMREGRLTLTGRTKDAIIINGVNYYSYAIESAVEELADIETSYTAACAIRTLEDTTDQLAIFFVPSRSLDEIQMTQLLQAIRSHVAKTVGIVPEYVLPLERDSIPKTPIGKIQRPQLRKAFENGEFSGLQESLERMSRTAEQTGSRLVVGEEWTRELIWKELVLCFEKELGVNRDRAESGTNILSLGVNSIKMMKLIRLIEKSFQIKMTARELYKHPTFESLAELVFIKTAEQYAGSPDAGGIGISSRESGDKRTARGQLSEVQKGLWTLQKMDPESCVYHIPLGLRFAFKVDIEKLKLALKYVLEQHPILTSVIVEVDGVPCRTIQPSGPLSITMEDISMLKESKIVAHLREKAKKPFTAEGHPLLNIFLFSRSEEEHYLLVVIHHLVFDGVSSMTLMHSLLDGYKQLEQGQIPTAQHATENYDDYVAWEQSMLSGEEGEKHRNYWLQQLSGTLPNLQLPADRPKTSRLSRNGHTCSKLIPAELKNSIKTFASHHSISMTTVLLAGYMILLNRYAGQEEMIVGMPVMTRPEERFESMIGNFLNMLPIREKIRDQATFEEFIQNLQYTLLDGLDHAVYPLPRMVQNRNKSFPGGSQLFQTAFYSQNFQQSTSYKQLIHEYAPDSSIEFVDGLHQEGEYELIFELWDEDDRMTLNIKYDADAFEASTVEKLGDSYMSLMESLIRNSALALEQISMLSEKDENTVLHEWNATQTDYPDASLPVLFEQQAGRTPDAIAAICDNVSLTYQELNERSTLLAIYLQAQGIVPDSTVAICVDRSLDMIIGLLGILKAGAAYVPLDPDYPEERLAYMLEDSKASVLLTQSELRNKRRQLFEKVEKVISLDQDWKESIQVAEGRTLKQNLRPEHLAYVLYTSGSTGKPKGVMISHRALVNFLSSMSKKPGLRAEDRLLAVTTYCFDIAGLELFLPLLMGAQCYLCKSDVSKDAEKLKKEIQAVRPTIMQATPATWSMLFQSGWKNEERVKVLCGGEALPSKLKQYFISSGTEAWNMFGPTETTIWSTVHHIQSEEPVSIGRPIANTQVYIVDKQLRLVPIGIPGELCIAGDGLARGYYNQPALTAEKFVDNPFQPGTRLYRTGDLSRWLPDGQIEYLGRIDNQVKLRGFRIELGAIETRLSEHKGIEDAVAVVKQAGEHKTLVAYYTAREDKTTPQARELQSHLKIGLPDYMVPAHVIRVDRMPLTPSGKIDRKELADRPVTVQRAHTQSMPESRLEQAVLAIWEDVLQVGGMGNRDGFFDVGGDSLLAVTVAERIRKELACEFTAMDLFEYPTIQAIASYIAAQQHDGIAALDMARDEGLEIGGKEDQTRGTRGELDAEFVAELPEACRDSLAIIGISCEFPGAGNHLEFWNNLLSGQESLKFFTKEEIRALGVPEELAENAAYVPVQSTIAGKDRFDPGFFNLSPKDAGFMDPQLRLLLLHAWKAVEDAGYVASEIPHTSVFMTGSNNGYRSLLPEEWTESLESPDGYVSWVLAQSGTIPTMISHKLGLKGPSYFVHANCSSSLVGLYSAYQSLQSGESKYALVGGATLHTGTGVGYVHQAGLNFSSDGHVKAFDASADGMIGGEGAAVLLLKKAADAVADGDHIYALIRGIGLNNDGGDKVGFYAPSVKGQADVIRKVLETTGIDPESISYVEAHGTGTKLGDPIELSALSAVYREHTQRKQYCGIGSVKTNIGHLDTAAGMAGCIKVAMSLYHGELAPTINYKEPNPNMDLESSPFYVVESRKRLEAKEEPYRAALSSFGLGGTNTHAIFEQYRRAAQEEPGSGPYLFPVSAKNQERLRAYAESLLEFMNEGNLENDSLADLAYTFQVGREAMDSRVAFVAADAAELKSQLENYLQGHGSKRSLGLYTGERKQETEALLENDEDSKKLVRAWITGGRLSKLAEAWCQGMSVDWTLLYRGTSPHRMSAPTYPFAQERLQIPRSNGKRVTAEVVASAEEKGQVSYLHPLLHLNTSDMLEQRFSSTFTGKEFFLADHVVRGNPVLPGVAYLEMARTAIQLSQGRSQHKQTGIRLKHVVWIQPIVSDGTPAEVHIGLFPEADGRIGYEIYSLSADDDSELVHGQGTAEWMDLSEPITWDLQELLRRCKVGELSSTDFYEDARRLGISFGAGFQGIQSLYAGEREVLSKLVIPAAVVKTRDSYVLHPSMLDAALQTATICIMRGGAGHKLLLPFALEELEVYGPCTSEMWAYARFSPGNKAGDPVQRVDVDLCDELGALRVKIKGFTARVLEGGVQAVADSSSKIERLLLEPIWVERPAASDQPIYEYEKHLIFLCDTAAVARERIISHLPGAEVFCLDSQIGTPSMRFEAYAGEMFEHIKSILLSKLEGNLLIQTVVCHQGEEQIYSGLTGLLKTAGLEYSKLSGQFIEISGDPHNADMPGILKENARHPSVKHIRYTDGKRYGTEWQEMDQKLVKDTSVPWKDRGVYLITGGAGRLGLLFAKEIGEKVSQATVILTGRGALREEQEQQVDRLRGMQLHVAYKQLDATDSEAVQRLIGEIVAEYGHLDGIIHGAGILQDNIIIKKTRGELVDVMAPKVSGLVYLDEASRELPLDFFFTFSSISGSLGNPGQADYATANAFMDAYMGYRNELTQKSLRTGASLSVNWPLWKDGGMQVDMETEKLMMQNLGLVPMQTHSGIQALYDAYMSGKTQVFVVEGNRYKIKQKLLTAPMSKPIKGNHSKADVIHSDVKNKDQQSELQISLKQMVSDLLKVSLQDLDVDTELGEYGFDSISYTVFANQINTAYTFELAPTVFFEYGTLRNLTEFLVREYGDVLNSREASAKPEHVPNVEVDNSPTSTDVSDADVNRISKRQRNRFALQEEPSKATPFEPIAIVGISGKFPGAADIDEFWNNLIDEKDCITEIPQDRWDWRI
ncbi:long-chain-fatty-acid-CoA ligase [Paenibacillus pini JCM 16418]|uniref:Long-chain-fatty-acid-CoA ligase n=1 Tax=Paenibacillus pini JCM 16418 TaxID=1236976 RepID=W7YFQ4_9BACL|nr:non-ribosomal peptide synthetase [Paenibacillus pini]GAF07307.1 long-chain-fatty-acid-CoA ligase [Paenibacillus pini JCM 16418]